jgi:hypothetical protein
MEVPLHMFIYYQNAGQTHNINIDSKSSENVAKFRHSEMTVTNQNLH